MPRRKGGLARFEDAMRADPREAPTGVRWCDDAPIAMNPGSFSWHPDAATMLRVIAGAARELYQLEADEAAEFERDMEAVAATLGRAPVLTPSQVRAVNRVASGIGCIEWHGRFQDLARGASAFARGLRTEFRECVDECDDECDGDGEDEAGGPGGSRLARAARRGRAPARPSSPIGPDEEEAFIEFLTEWNT